MSCLFNTLSNLFCHCRCSTAPQPKAAPADPVQQTAAKAKRVSSVTIADSVVIQMINPTFYIQREAVQESASSSSASSRTARSSMITALQSQAAPADAVQQTAKMRRVGSIYEPFSSVLPIFSMQQAPESASSSSASHGTARSSTMRTVPLGTLERQQQADLQKNVIEKAEVDNPHKKPQKNKNLKMPKPPRADIIMRENREAQGKRDQLHPDNRARSNSEPVNKDNNDSSSSTTRPRTPTGHHPELRKSRLQKAQEAKQRLTAALSPVSTNTSQPTHRATLSQLVKTILSSSSDSTVSS